MALWRVLIVACLSVGALLLAGWRPVVPLSDSMAPVVRAGDLVVARPVAAEDVRIGDVITVRLGDGPSITHRVVAVEQTGERRVARLQGDANEAPDLGRALLGPRTLRAVVVIPWLGRLVLVGPALTIGVTLLAAGWLWLARIRRHRVVVDGSAEPSDDVSDDPERSPHAQT